MHGDGHGKKAPLDLSFDPVERLGLTTEQFEEKVAEFGYNELPVVTISAWWVFFLQFTGTMPYMLEVAAIISIGCTDYPDFAVICAMLIANAVLGFHEQMKAAASLVKTKNKKYFFLFFFFKRISFYFFHLLFFGCIYTLLI